MRRQAEFTEGFEFVCCFFWQGPEAAGSKWPSRTCSVLCCLAMVALLALLIAIACLALRGEAGRERAAPFPETGQGRTNLNPNPRYSFIGHGIFPCIFLGSKNNSEREAVKVVFLRKTSKDLSLELIFGHDSKKI